MRLSSQKLAAIRIWYKINQIHPNRCPSRANSMPLTVQVLYDYFKACTVTSKLFVRVMSPPSYAYEACHKVLEQTQ